jgi:membrane protein required for colicin V production
MTVFDFGVVAILLISLLFGLWRGLLYEVLSILGWPIAFVVSNIFADGIAQHIPINHEMARLIGAYALVFVAVMIVWGMLVLVLTKLMRMIGLGQVDRMLGGMFGLVRGLLLVLAVVWLAGMTDFPEQPFWREAQMSRGAEDVALLTKSWLPESIAQRIHYRARK